MTLLMCPETREMCQYLHNLQAVVGSRAEQEDETLQHRNAESNGNSIALEAAALFSHLNFFENVLTWNNIVPTEVSTRRNNNFIQRESNKKQQQHL